MAARFAISFSTSKRALVLLLGPYLSTSFHLGVAAAAPVEASEISSPVSASSGAAAADRSTPFTSSSGTKVNAAFLSLFGSKKRLLSSKPVCTAITNPGPVSDSPSCQLACSAMEGCNVGAFNSDPNMLQCDCSGAGCGRTICTSGATPGKGAFSVGVIGALLGAVLLMMHQ